MDIIIRLYYFLRFCISYGLSIGVGKTVASGHLMRDPG
jgi:hypothetical protein